MRLYGIIGYPLTHTFSPRYFSEKFLKENIRNVRYDKYELESITLLPDLVEKTAGLQGLNVTIPYKQIVMPYLDTLDISAQEVGAVNVIKITNGLLVGYNSDYYGFQTSLSLFLPTQHKGIKALILGSGGAAKAVEAALRKMSIPYQTVSRSPSPNFLTYNDLTPDVIQHHHLIINTTPLGMYPDIDTCPDIPYSLLTRHHYLYDLVYNPELTLFLQKGAQHGTQVKNGLEMLHLQAEKAWDIWEDKLE